jgi:methanethiol S-methyltransferase
MRINQRPLSGAPGAATPSTVGTRLKSTALAAGSAAAYAIVHSALLMPPAEALAAHVFGSGTHRWYRLSYNVLAIALLELQDALLARLPDRRLYSLSGVWRVALPAASLASLAGLALCLHHTDAAQFLGVRQSGWLHQWMARHPRHLVDTGPCGVVRHPTYLCMLGVLWLRPSLTQNRLAANLVYTLYLAVASFLEEKRLVRELGPDYIAYRRRVPRLLPSLKRR